MLRVVTSCAAAVLVAAAVARPVPAAAFEQIPESMFGMALAVALSGAAAGMRQTDPPRPAGVTLVTAGSRLAEGRAAATPEVRQPGPK